MIFDALREKIKSCQECKPKHCHCPPLYFKCNNPDEVKVIVISEQPMETDNIITEDSIKECLRGERRGSPTINDIAELFSEEYKNSILKDGGKFFWTHHTKCPSSKRNSIQKNCPQKWLTKEITIFPNLQYIITISSPAHEAIMSMGGCKPNLTDALWKEFELVIFNEHYGKDIEIPTIKICGKVFNYISLPHTTNCNPLSNFIPYLSPLIRKVEEAI